MRFGLSLAHGQRRNPTQILSLSVPSELRDCIAEMGYGRVGLGCQQHLTRRVIFIDMLQQFRYEGGLAGSWRAL